MWGVPDLIIIIDLPNKPWSNIVARRLIKERRYLNRHLMNMLFTPLPYKGYSIILISLKLC